MLGRGSSGVDRREIVERQGEQQAQQQAQRQAVQQATNPAALEKVQDSSFVETLGDADVGDDDLQEFAQTELSRINILGDLDEAEYRRQQILTQNRAEQMKAELVPETGPGSKCRGEIRRIMVGHEEPTATPSRTRRIDSAVGEEGVRANMLSMAVGGRGLDAVSKIQSVTQAYTDGSTGRSGEGVISKAKRMLFG
jgi:hypothetical protein